MKSVDDFFALSKIKNKRKKKLWSNLRWIKKKHTGAHHLELRRSRYDLCDIILWCSSRRSRWIIFLFVFLFLSVSDSFSFSTVQQLRRNPHEYSTHTHTQLKGFTLVPQFFFFSCFVAPLNNITSCPSSSSSTTTTFSFLSNYIWHQRTGWRSGRIKTNAIVPFITPTCHGQEFRRDCNLHVRTIQ